VTAVGADAARVFELPPGRDRFERGALGRRARSLVRLRRGKYSRHRLARRGDRDVAFDATLRAAAARGERRVGPQDLRRKVREHRAPLSVCFVVDNSYSLHADRIVERIKGLAFELLRDATGRGDRVSLVAFRGGLPEATVALPLTRSTRLAAARLRDVPLSGQTPLADALATAGRVLRQDQIRRPNAVPVVVAVTDGLPTVGLRAGGDPVADAVAEARALRRRGVRLVVVDADSSGASCGSELARAAAGVHLPIDEVSPEVLLGAVGTAC
jgi:magnesium chelatase subunit D